MTHFDLSTHSRVGIEELNGKLIDFYLSDDEMHSNKIYSEKNKTNKNKRKLMFCVYKKT